MSLEKAIADVTAFHEACGVPVCGRPKTPDIARQMLRAKLMQEEFKELMNEIEYCAESDAHLHALAKEMADLIYVVIGSALEYGIPLDEAWNEVQRSNMSKMDPETGKAIKRDDGKVLKGPNYSPADIQSIIEKAR